MQLASMGELGEKGDGKEKARNNDEVERKLIWLNLLLKFIKCYSVNVTKERDSPRPMQPELSLTIATFKVVICFLPKKTLYVFVGLCSTRHL